MGGRGPKGRKHHTALEKALVGGKVSLDEGVAVKTLEILDADFETKKESAQVELIVATLQDSYFHAEYFRAFGDDYPGAVIMVQRLLELSPLMSNDTKASVGT